MRRSSRGAGSAGTGLFLEELIGRAQRSLLAGLVCLEPRNLLAQKPNALVELPDREQREVLPDLMGQLLFRPLVVVDRWHRRVPSAAAYRGACRLSHRPPRLRVVA